MNFTCNLFIVNQYFNIEHKYNHNINHDQPLSKTDIDVNNHYWQPLSPSIINMVINTMISTILYHINPSYPWHGPLVRTSMVSKSDFSCTTSLRKAWADHGDLGWEFWRFTVITHHYCHYHLIWRIESWFRIMIYSGG